LPAHILACSVRDCGLPLEPDVRRFVCPRGHSFDIARSGYINLLQPQDRRSLAAGDSPAAVSARADLLARGIGRSIVEGFVDLAAALDLPASATVIDLGSGSGEVLTALALRRQISGFGIDLSAAAAEHAARQYPSLTWIVANADRRLPIQDVRVDLALSLNARRNPAECARVLRPRSSLLVGIPGPDDLIELRTLLLGEPVTRDRTDGVVTEHDEWFELMERSTLRERQRLDREALVQLLRGTYRGERLSSAPRVASLETMEVTLATDVLAFRLR
jgi:23S rRNA (guanine745-N1)-methyltransferase